MFCLDTTDQLCLHPCVAHYPRAKPVIKFLCLEWYGDCITYFFYQYYYTVSYQHIDEKQLYCEGNTTRLLGRPQPQMYPPVALNQYTLVNRTHKHFIYICFKAPQTYYNHTKAQQYVKYGSNLTIFLIFVFIWRGVHFFWGGGGFNNQTGPILVHIYPLFNNN